MEVHVHARVDAVAVQRRYLAGHLHEHAQRGGHGEHDDGKKLVHVLEHREERESRDDDDVVEDGPEVAPEVVAVRVEHAREDRGEPVEEDLEREEAEEEDRRVHAVRVAAHERLRPDEGRGKDRGGEREHPQEEEQDAEEVADVLLRPALSAPAAHVHVDGQEGGDEHAAHHEVVEHRGEVLRHLVGGGEERDAERHAHDPRAHEARDAAHHDEAGHQARGAAHALVVARGGEVIVVARDRLDVLLGVPLGARRDLVAPLDALSGGREVLSRAAVASRAPGLARKVGAARTLPAAHASFSPLAWERALARSFLAATSAP